MSLEMIVRSSAAALAGGLIGYGLYRVVGCSTGACPLTSNPYISVLYGMTVGLILALR